MRPRISIRGSVRPYVRLSVCPSVCPSVNNYAKPPKNTKKSWKYIVVIYWSITNASICPLGLVIFLFYSSLNCITVWILFVADTEDVSLETIFHLFGILSFCPASCYSAKNHDGQNQTDNYRCKCRWGNYVVRWHFTDNEWCPNHLLFLWPS